jgi:hypothetical protein
MRAGQVVAIALASAAAVVAADLLMHSSLLRLLRPRILSPADGAIVSGPVTVLWDGPQPMQATLTGNGLRINLGERESPFEIDPSRFPRPGQYGLELSLPRFGLIGADRRFMVRRAVHGRGGSTSAPFIDDPAAAAERPAPPASDMAALVAERDRLRVDLAGLEAQLETLRAELASSDEELDATQADADARILGAEAEQDAMAREHALMAEENEALRQRLQSIPPCVVWGYLAVPRPQTSPPSRMVLVSNRRGDVFRSEGQCLASRRGDPTGVSGCACVGTVFQ